MTVTLMICKLQRQERSSLPSTVMTLGHQTNPQRHLLKDLTGKGTLRANKNSLDRKFVISFVLRFAFYVKSFWCMHILKYDFKWYEALEHLLPPPPPPKKKKKKERNFHIEGAILFKLWNSKMINWQLLA